MAEKTRKACGPCINSKVKCDQGRPCTRCTRRAVDCFDMPSKPRVVGKRTLENQQIMTFPIEYIPPQAVPAPTPTPVFTHPQGHYIIDHMMLTPSEMQPAYHNQRKMKSNPIPPTTSHSHPHTHPLHSHPHLHSLPPSLPPPTNATSLNFQPTNHNSYYPTSPFHSSPSHPSSSQAPIDITNCIYLSPTPKSDQTDDKSPLSLPSSSSFQPLVNMPSLRMPLFVCDIPSCPKHNPNVPVIPGKITLCPRELEFARTVSGPRSISFDKPNYVLYIPNMTVVDATKSLTDMLGFVGGPPSVRGQKLSNFTHFIFSKFFVRDMRKILTETTVTTFTRVFGMKHVNGSFVFGEMEINLMNAYLIGTVLNVYPEIPSCYQYSFNTYLGFPALPKEHALCDRPYCGCKFAHIPLDEQTVESLPLLL